MDFLGLTISDTVVVTQSNEITYVDSELRAAGAACMHEDLKLP